MRRMLVATRIHKGSSSQMASAESVIDFVRNSAQFATSVLICIGNDNSSESSEYIEHIKIALEKADLSSNVILLPINPWGHFTTALNCALQRAVDDGYSMIAFQSLEFRIGPDVVARLATHFENVNTLVVGPAISGHEFIEGTHLITGRTCPWNTFALWSVEHLAVAGFPPVGDGFGQTRENGGVEEVTAISLAQLIRPDLQAYLVSIAGVEWETNFSDPLRAEYHEKKMKSKNERPLDQIRRSGIPPGRVCHVIQGSAA